MIGNKNNKDLYKNLLEELIPENIILYVEPFGGMFGLFELIKTPHNAIYNEINTDIFCKVKEKYINNTNVYCFNRHYKNIIKYFDHEDTFFYLDPPYYKNENYYKNHPFLEKKHHIELYEILKNIKGKFLLSYQDRDLMRELYKDFNIYKYTGNNFILKPEIAITNYK